MAHQLAGVDVADADDVLGDEIVVKAAGGPPVADGGAGIANHVSGHPDTGGFRILPVDSRVPDVRERLHHDLPIVTGIGQSLLITGHAGREHDLASGLADRAVRVTHIHLPVLKYKHGVIRGKTHGFGIILVHQNPLIVKVFVPTLTVGEDSAGFSSFTCGLAVLLAGLWTRPDRPHRYIVERHVVEIDAVGDVIVLGRFGIAGFDFRIRRFTGRLTRLMTVVARLCVGLVVFGVENGLASFGVIANRAEQAVDERRESPSLNVLARPSASSMATRSGTSSLKMISHAAMRRILRSTTAMRRTFHPVECSLSM